MASKIILAFFLMTSVCYAEIQPVTIDDMCDHSRMKDKLNEVISEINNIDMERKASIETLKTELYPIKYDVNMMKSNFGKMRSVVKDPTGTVVDIKTKFLLLMDSIEKAPNQHLVATP